MTAEVYTRKEKEIKVIEEEAGEMTWLLKFLHASMKILLWIPVTHIKTWVLMACTCNPNIAKVETEGFLEFPG